MNCSELDVFVGDAHALATRSAAPVFVVGVTAVLALSLTLLVAGGRLLRTLGAVLAGLLSAWGIFALTRTGAGLSCELRIVFASLAALAAALLAVYIFKTGLFVLGGAAFGVVAHLVYESLPLPPPHPSFMLFDRAGYYYFVVGTAALLGAVLAVAQRDPFMRLVSAMLGGGFLAVGVHAITLRSGGELPALAAVAVAIVSTLCGVGVQRALTPEARRARREKRRERRRAPVAGVPVGVAVE